MTLMTTSLSGSKNSDSKHCKVSFCLAAIITDLRTDGTWRDVYKQFANVLQLCLAGEDEQGNPTREEKDNGKGGYQLFGMISRQWL